MKNYILICLSILLVSCNPIIEDPIPEDYEKLFPFGGIEKPEIAYEDMTHNQCDIENYIYPGITVTNNPYEYKVTVKCKYSKGSINNNVSEPNYLVKYVNEKLQLVTASSYSYDNPEVLLENNLEKIIQFKVKSGYPLYLSVSGTGDIQTRIEASIEATSVDGIFDIPKLSFAMTQNRIRIHQIQPYCEYIILP